MRLVRFLRKDEQEDFKMRLASIISRIEKHKKAAKNLVKKDVSNYLVFNSLAMECFQAVNSAIELGEFIQTI
jgi:hypothetical protein